MKKFKCFSGKPGDKPAKLIVEAEDPDDVVASILAVSCSPHKRIGPKFIEDWDGKTTYRYPIQDGWQIYVQE